MGSRGIFCSTSNKKIKNSYFNMDSFVDINKPSWSRRCSAYATLTMLSTNNLAAAGIIGSLAAACECEMDGNTPVTPKKFLRR